MLKRRCAGRLSAVVTRLYGVMAVITLFARSTGNQAVRLDLLLDGDSNREWLSPAQKGCFIMLSRYASLLDETTSQTYKGSWLPRPSRRNNNHLESGLEADFDLSLTKKRGTALLDILWHTYCIMHVPSSIRIYFGYKLTGNHFLSDF